MRVGLVGATVVGGWVEAGVEEPEQEVALAAKDVTSLVAPVESTHQPDFGEVGFLSDVTAAQEPVLS